MKKAKSNNIQKQAGNDFLQGTKDSLPIVAGYFSVSFTFGIMAAKAGMSPWLAALISLTNVTSAGQFAGLTLMLEQASYLEMVLTQLTINLRYGLMSISLSQHLTKDATTPKRLAIAFANTDEIFALSVSRPEPASPKYMAGLEIFPVISWTLGTFAGAVATELLPPALQSALGIALYGMFVAIVLPPAREKHSVAIVALLAAGLSTALKYLPVLNKISSGFSIIICTLLAAGLGAVLFPIPDPRGDDDDLPEFK